MNNDSVRSPDGSGYSAEPEPEEVSAVPVSIPNAAHSPGPWSIRWTCSGASIYDPIGRRTAYTSAPAKGMKRDEVVANAELIASAPTLAAEVAALIHDLERVMERENAYLNALIVITAMRGKAAEVARRALYDDDPILAQAIEAQRAATPAE